MTNEKLRVGIVGTGGMGKVHARAFMKNPEVEVYGVCSGHVERARQFARGEWGPIRYGYFCTEIEPITTIPHIYNDYREMARDLQIDAVTICTPNSLHAPIALEILNHQKHVLLEKPMTNTLAEANEIIGAAEKAGVVLLIGYMWRFHRDVQWVRRVVEEGTIGRVVQTKSYAIHMRWAAGGWFADKKLAGGGAVVDMGVHAIDTTRYLIGEPEPKSVYAHVRTKFGSYDVDDLGLLVITFDGDVVSVVECGRNFPFADGEEASTEIFGDRGFARVFPTQVHLKVGDRWGCFEPELPEDHDTLETYQREIDHFVDCIRKRTKPIIGSEVGKVVMEITEAAYESSQTGKVVKLR